MASKSSPAPVVEISEMPKSQQRFYAMCSLVTPQEQAAAKARESARSTAEWLIQDLQNLIARIDDAALDLSGSGLVERAVAIRESIEDSNRAVKAAWQARIVIENLLGAE